MYRFGALCFFFLAGVRVYGNIFINEIHYDPPDLGFEAGSLREFVELVNGGDSPVFLAGYRFTRGIDYVFPEGIVLEPGEYLVVARTPSHPVWDLYSTQVVGPFEGKLSNEGERIRLEDPSGAAVEDFTYDDTFPWPAGADGYGPSLERLRHDLPAGDYHNWRASLTDNGTPGGLNSVNGTPPQPLIIRSRTIPEHPTSSDPVIVRVVFDSPAEIQSATLQYQPFKMKSSNYGSRMISQAKLLKVSESPIEATYETILPVFSSQTLVRYNCILKLLNGGVLFLPHRAEPRPFDSFFVYNHEIVSLLPVLWRFDPLFSTLTGASQKFSGVVIQPSSVEQAVAYDGAEILNSRNGNKVKFLKEKAYLNNRTLNLIPEMPQEGLTAGKSAPFREDLAFWYFNHMGVSAPQTHWLRVIYPGNPGTQTQQLGIEQINEDFLDRIGLSQEAYLFKRNYVSPYWEPHLNEELGNSILFDLESALRPNLPLQRRQIIEQSIDQDIFLAYSIVSMLLTNWDGYHNNHWMYKNLAPGTLWQIFPWDQDKAWGYTDTTPFYTEFPLTYPITGTSPGVTRSPGPILSPLHQDATFYGQFLFGLRRELDQSFTDNFLYPEIEQRRSLLLSDLTLLEGSIGKTRTDRRDQINNSYNTIRNYILARRDYLLGQLQSYDPSQKPPFLRKAAFARRNQVLVLFERPLLPDGALDVQHYWMTPGNLHPSQVTLYLPDQVLLEFENPFLQHTAYILRVEGVRDVETSAPLTPAQARRIEFSQPRVSITEIQYDNRGDDLEWIELHNTLDEVVDISGWMFTDDESYPPRGEGYGVFREGSVLDGGEYVVVNLWNKPDFWRWKMPPSVRILHPLVKEEGALSNGGDNLLLFDAEVGGQLVDGAFFANYPDLCTEGESLEKVDELFPWGDEDTVDLNFRKAAVPLGFSTEPNENGNPLSTRGSPGRRNGTEITTHIDDWIFY